MIKKQKMMIYSMIFITVLLLLPSISAETIYHTGFEDETHGNDYVNSWMKTTVQDNHQGGFSYIITDDNSYSGQKCYRCRYPDAGGNIEFSWDFTLQENEYLTKFEMYMKFDDKATYNAFTCQFFDSKGLNFIMLDDMQSSQSDMAFAYYYNNSWGLEEIFGYAIKNQWVKVGFEVLSNDSIRYFVGENSAIGKPFNVIDTEYPRLNRMYFSHYNAGPDNYYFDDLTIYTNHVPTADPNGPYLGNKNEQVTFDGSNSTDLDGTISSYSWDFGDGNIGTGQKPTHTYNNAGTYTVKLTVTDNDEGENTETTSIIITESESNSNGNKSPGFDVIVLLGVILILLLIKRLKRK